MEGMTSSSNTNSQKLPAAVQSDAPSPNRPCSCSEPMGTSSPKITPDDSNIDEELNIQPCLGMEFVSVEKVREFYTSFAKRNGFGVRLRSTKPKIATLVCCNEGQRRVKICENEEEMTQRKRKCSTSRTGCQASLTVSRGIIESNWVIKSFNNDHNHGMVSPRSVSYMRCHKKMSVTAKSLVEKFEEEGLSTGKVRVNFQKGGVNFQNVIGT